MNLFGSNSYIHPQGMFPSEWRKPLNISIALHVVILAFAMLAPHLFVRQPILPEIYTVNLFSATEVTELKTPAPSRPTHKAPAQKTVRQIEPEQVKPAVSIHPPESEPPPVAETAIAKPISLAPRKLKIKVGKSIEEQEHQKAMLNKVVQRLQANAARKQAAQEATVAAKDAVGKLADALKTASAVTPATGSQAAGEVTESENPAAVSGPRGTGVEPDFYMKQYLAAVYQKIEAHWVLPDLQNWENNLEAILSITIRRDGTITDSYFEKKTENIYFNQFVLKAVKDASPLPPFPDQLREKTLEIGLRFRPGELL